jgi:hypothetical protein
LANVGYKKIIIYVQYKLDLMKNIKIEMKWHINEYITPGASGVRACVV